MTLLLPAILTISSLIITSSSIPKCHPTQIYSESASPCTSTCRYAKSIRACEGSIARCTCDRDLQNTTVGEHLVWDRELGCIPCNLCPSSFPIRSIPTSVSSLDPFVSPELWTEEDVSEYLMSLSSLPSYATASSSFIAFLYLSESRLYSETISALTSTSPSINGTYLWRLTQNGLKNELVDRGLSEQNAIRSSRLLFNTLHDITCPYHCSCDVRMTMMVEGDG
jgi:hypothetical protein